MKLPYLKIETYLDTTDDHADEPVDIFLDCDEMRFVRQPAIAEKDFDAIPEVDLTFSIESAIRLRDFLNFALPVDK